MTRHSIRCAIGAILALASLAPLTAADPPAVPPVSGKPGRIDHMQYGPAIAYTVRAPWPKNNIAYKGLAVRLGEKHDAAIVYDTDLMRIAAASTGGHLDISKINYTSYKGSDVALIAGEQILGASTTPGWANPQTGKFDDPRDYPSGPLPKAWLHYRGHYLHGDNVVLAYRVGDCDVLETPGTETIDGYTFITRTIQLGKSKSDLTLLVAELDKSFNLRAMYGGDERLSVSEAAGLAGELLKDSDKPRVFYLSVVSDAKEHRPKLARDGRRFTLSVPAAATPVRLKLLHWLGTEDAATGAGPRVQEDINKAARKARPPGGVAGMTQGGPARWPDTVATPCKLADDNAAYVLDHIGVPLDNPYNSWMRLVGFDFFSDGTRAAVSTWNGDVWIVSGITPGNKLDKVTWRRFATGLFEPLGIVVRDDEVFALGRDRITRLHDLDGDGEADFYESFNSDCLTYPRAITCELHADSKGNFYLQKNGNRTPGNVPLHGCILRVSADGSKQDVFATGLRSANGMGIGPDDTVAMSDQEGNWTPVCRIDLLRGGEFIGYKPHAHTETEPPDDAYKRPLCWLPKSVDNSTGGLAFADSDRWGPLKGHWLVTSYGQAKLLAVLTERIPPDEHRAAVRMKLGIPQPRENWQGGVVELPLNFGTGIHRLRFNKRDGQLYVVGMRGWQTRGVIDGGFYRVRYTGKPALLPVALHATKTGVRITFCEPLDRELAQDTDSYAVKRWNYLYTEKYGSPEMSVADPTKQGRDDVKVLKATLSDDGRTVELAIEDMKPVMQMMVKLDLETAAGEPIRREVYHTVHWLGD